MAGRVTAGRVMAPPRIAPGRDPLEQNYVSGGLETKQ
jgi:hypothetical protein